MTETPTTSGYFEAPITVGEAIHRYGAEAVPRQALDDPAMYCVDGIGVHGQSGRVRCTVAVRAGWLAANTDYRRVAAGGHQETVYLCPVCGIASPHYDDHWDQDKGVHRKTVRS